MSFTQPETKSKSGNFLVKKIHEGVDYYLIFLKKDSKNYTIFSKKNLTINGIDIKKGNTYYFELIPVKDTLNGLNISPAYNPEMVYFGCFRGKEIGILYTAKNLSGLRIEKKDKID
jgi:hypothetical protein